MSQATDTEENVLWRHSLTVELCSPGGQGVFGAPAGGRGKESVSPGPCRGGGALPTPGFWISDLQNCETRNFCCFKPSVYGLFVTATLGKSYTSLRGFYHHWNSQIVIITWITQRRPLEARLKLYGTTFCWSCPIVLRNHFWHMMCFQQRKLVFALESDDAHTQGFEVKILSQHEGKWKGPKHT